MLLKLEFLAKYKQLDPDAPREEINDAWEEELERERQEKERERQFELEKLRLQKGYDSKGMLLLPYSPCFVSLRLCFERTGGVERSVWEHLAVALPSLHYELKEVSTQGKSTTEYAAFSHTPVSVVDWDFERLIEQEAKSSSYKKNVTSRIADKLQQQLLHVVHEEEHVTQNVVTVLNCAKDLLAVEFVSGNKYLTSNTDITALSIGVDGLSVRSSRVGPCTMYASPAGNRKKARAEHMHGQKKSVRLPIESKPFWKYRDLLVDDFSFHKHFEVPKAPWTGTDPLPKSWSSLKRKVFHLIRQVYGQMTVDNLRYGVIHVYERWWFCRRDGDGTLSVSGGFNRESTEPSVLQALKTLLRLDNYELNEAAFHDQTPIKAPAPRPPKSGPDVGASSKSAQPTEQTNAKSKGGGDDKQSQGSGEKQSSATLTAQLATR